MFKFIFLILQLYFVAVFCYTYKKPDKPCDITDNDCVTKMVAGIFDAAVNGDISEGFQAIDPMHQDLITANLPNVTFSLKDSTILGLKELQILSANISGHDSTFATMMFPRYEMSGMYEIDGVFFDTPIKGNGRYTIKATDLKLYFEAMSSYYKKDDGVHLRVTDFDFTTELLGTLNVDIENLFDGNKELGDAALKALNSNDKMLAVLWNTPITRANMKIMFANVNKVHAGVLLNDLITENLSTKTIIN